MECFRQGSGIADMLDAYPHLDEKQIEATLAYYLKTPDLVDEDVRQNDEAWQQLISQSWPGSA